MNMNLYGNKGCFILVQPYKNIRGGLKCAV